MRIASFAIASVLLFGMASNIGAQKLSFGIVGGRALTTDFAPIYRQFDSSRPTFFSESKSWLIGPSAEYAIRPELSIVFNALNRTLHATGRDIREDGSVHATSTYPVATWEFPVLIKYSHQAHRLRPYFEAGPTFRTAGNLNGTNPSNFGFAAGLGLEAPLAAGWSISPGVRYSRWAHDSNRGGASTKQDVVEVLVGVSHRSPDDVRPFGDRLSVGVLMGTAVSNDFVSTKYDGISPEGELVTVRSGSGRRSLLPGVSVELRLGRKVAVEADALYRSLRRQTEWDEGTIRLLSNTSTQHIWEVPVLAKYRFGSGEATPFLGAGVVLRTLGAGDDPRYGLSWAAGADMRWKRLKITPQLRYSRWATDASPQIPADQIQVFVGFSY